jgi:hypothetical protein
MTNTNTKNDLMTIHHKAQPVALSTLKKGAHFKRKLNALGYYRKEGFNHANKSQGLKASYTCGDPYELGRSIELKPETLVYPCDGFGELAEIYTADQYVLVEYILVDQPDSKFTKEVVCAEEFRSTSKQLVMAEAENIELYKIFRVPHGQEIDRKKALESFIIENRKAEAEKAEAEKAMSYPIKSIPMAVKCELDNFASAIVELKEHLIDTIKEYPLTDQNIDEAHYYAFNEDYYIIYHSRAKEWLERHNIDTLEAIDFIQRKSSEMYGEPQEVPTDYETIVNQFVCFLGDEITPHAETVSEFLELLEA